MTENLDEQVGSRFANPRTSQGLNPSQINPLSSMNKMDSIDSTVVNLGEFERQLGLCYVALSRVRTLQGLSLEKEYDFNRFPSVTQNPTLRLRLLAEQRLISISL